MERVGLVLIVSGFACAGVALIAYAAMQWRSGRRFRTEMRLYGRQQIRAAYRAEAARQLARAPAVRRVRRQAVSELLHGGSSLGRALPGTTARSSRASSTTSERGA